MEGSVVIRVIALHDINGLIYNTKQERFASKLDCKQTIESKKPLQRTVGSRFLAFLIQIRWGRCIKNATAPYFILFGIHFILHKALKFLRTMLEAVLGKVMSFF